ncbi:uncharacterized protein [Spinacia oleracea]|uniref:Reverse transcriptase domain-containing protein n=1 Tax=Spinacia oleracea TaxID=3562 RepID=A0ABM3RR90_SPIOL|nr:uncharacterized protein LOC110806057 [Spinacia oleracea]
MHQVQSSKAQGRQNRTCEMETNILFRNVVHKLKKVKLALKELNRSGFPDIQAADLQAYHDMVTAHNAMHLHPADQTLADAEIIAEKAAWLKDGDENTSLFHQSIKARNVHNQVYSIHDMDGVWRDNPTDISQAFSNYYTDLLGTTHTDRRHVLRHIVHSGPMVTDAHRAILNAPYTTAEVKKALFSIPGQGKLLKELNHTVITLIPKTKSPKNILPDLIIENQGGFVHGKYIVHNIMVVQDLVKQYGRKSAKPSCMMKIGLQKAYDTVDWEFLKEMLVHLGFPSDFLALVMECVFTPKFSLMLNGTMHGFFKSERGLRQGDPMSPLLFVLCMEYLSRILNRMSEFPQFQFHPRAFELFSASSGLLANKQKSSIYCCDMSENDITRVVNVSGFTRSKLPFKYLGVPICAKRISVAQCDVLVDKMIARIKVFILPKRLLQEVTKFCRSFLWSGQAYSHQISNISWESSCCDKKQGGLGFRDVITWNIANMGKYVWAIASKQDNVWINGFMLCTLKMGIGGITCLQLLLAVYEKIIGPKPLIHWDTMVWDRLNIPKHRFICWLAVQGRLQTTAKLARFGVSNSAACFLCGQADEDHTHLSLSLKQLMRFISHGRLSKFRRQVGFAMLAAAVYSVWTSRNSSFWNSSIPTVQNIVVRIKTNEPSGSDSFDLVYVGECENDNGDAVGSPGQLSSGYPSSKKGGITKKSASASDDA